MTSTQLRQRLDVTKIVTQGFSAAHVTGVKWQGFSEMRTSHKFEKKQQICESKNFCRLMCQHFPYPRQGGQTREGGVEQGHESATQQSTNKQRMIGTGTRVGQQLQKQKLKLKPAPRLCSRLRNLVGRLVKNNKNSAPLIHHTTLVTVGLIN